MSTMLQRIVRGLCLVLLVVPAMALASPAAEAQTGESYFVLYGEAGDYITQGSDIFHAESTDIEFTTSVNFDNDISVTINVRDNGAFVERWQTDFASPSDAPLAAGDNFLATRFPFQDAEDAGLSVFGAGRGCNSLFGEFAIRELTIGATGDVENFAPTSASPVMAAHQWSAASGSTRCSTIPTQTSRSHHRRQATPRSSSSANPVSTSPRGST